MDVVKTSRYIFNAFFCKRDVYEQAHVEHTLFAKQVKKNILKRYKNIYKIQVFSILLAKQVNSTCKASKKVDLKWFTCKASKIQLFKGKKFVE